MADRSILEARRHIGALTVAGMAVAATLAGWTPSTLAALIIVGFAVAIGMPHGALDVAVGPRALPSERFFAGYGALAALTVLCWFVAPMLSLAAFFAMSWFHFGSGDAKHRQELGGYRVAHGAATAGAVLGLPLLVHAEVVAPVVEHLLFGDATLTQFQISLVGLGITVTAAIAGALTLLQACRVASYAAIAELLAIVLLATIVHPLVSFAVYFALWHSPRHLMELDIDRSDVLPTLSATAITFAAAAVVWWVAAPSVATTTQVVFIGLAALTTPHLVVTEAVRRQRSTAGTEQVARLTPSRGRPPRFLVESTS